MSGKPVKYPFISEANKRRLEEQVVAKQCYIRLPSLDFRWSMCSHVHQCIFLATRTLSVYLTFVRVAKRSWMWDMASSNLVLY